MPGRRVVRPASLWQQRHQAATVVRALPAPQAGATAATELDGSIDALLACDPQQPGALTNDAELAAQPPSLKWSPAAGGEEAEARTFLVRVPKPASVGVAEQRCVTCSDLIHGRDARRVSETTGNFS
jgi:hypothetical protein